MARLGMTLEQVPKRQGKVRDVYDLGERLLMVASDRISAFDWILPNEIADKGRVLNGVSAFWFHRLDAPNHVISLDAGESGLALSTEEKAELSGRSMVVKKANVVPFECVVRGYLAGSGWKEYRASGSVCGEKLPAGLVESDRIPTTFTPATKAESGHDENVPFATMAREVGEALAETLRAMSLRLYEDAWQYAMGKGLILADTKFEWGIDPETNQIMLVDEALTPDSSRYWPLEGYKPGGPQPSFDKQFVRDWLETTSWDKASPPPRLPDDVVAQTREKYVQAYEILTGRSFPWK